MCVITSHISQDQTSPLIPHWVEGGGPVSRVDRSHFISPRGSGPFTIPPFYPAPILAPAYTFINTQGQAMVCLRETLSTISLPSEIQIGPPTLCALGFTLKPLRRQPIRSYRHSTRHDSKSAPIHGDSISAWHLGALQPAAVGQLRAVPVNKFEHPWGHCRSRRTFCAFIWIPLHPTSPSSPPATRIISTNPRRRQ